MLQVKPRPIEKITKEKPKANPTEYIDKLLAETCQVSLDAEWMNSKLNQEQYKKLSDRAKVFYNKYVRDITGQTYHLTVQAHVTYAGFERAIVFVENNLYQEIKQELLHWQIEYKRVSGVDVDVFPANLGYVNLLERVIEICNIPKEKTLQLVLFYSAKDLDLSLGFDYFDMLVKNKIVVQKRNIKVDSKTVGQTVKLPSGHKFLIKDTYGWTPVGGLKGFCGSVSVEMKAKKDLDDYKDIMLEAFITHTLVAMNYSIFDATDNLTAFKKFQRQISELVHRLIGLKIDFELPQTNGAMVARIFEEWLQSKANNQNDFQLALRKLGGLDPSDSNYKEHKELYDSVFSQKQYDGNLVKQILSPKIHWKFLAYSQASVNSFAIQFSHISAGLNALVQGGRCWNEAPNSFRLANTLDIDLKSCYGSALSTFTYPIGLPTLWGFTDNEKGITLREFLKQVNYFDAHGRVNKPEDCELVDGLFTITVSTKEELSFRQDLIFSKTATLDGVRKASVQGYKDKETDLDTEIGEWFLKDDPANIPGEFVLAKKEIVNGPITYDVLEVLQKVATDRERSELLDKLEVVTAAVYKRSDRVMSLDDWSAQVLESSGSYGSPTGKVRDIKDERCTKWWGVSIGEFLNPFLAERKVVKAEAKLDPSRKAVDKLLKLFINTLYGVLASPYFKIGNTVVANSITAKARVGAWKMNKALHTRQSVTDGGFYPPVQIPFIEKTKHTQLPGLDKLSNNENWGKTKNDRVRGQKFKSLADLNWGERFDDYQARVERLKEKYDTLIDEKYSHLPKEKRKAKKAEKLSKLLVGINNIHDTIALAHINEFWGNYGLDLGFKIEHKETHVSTMTAYLGKAHYSFETIQGDTVFAIRGSRNYEENHLRRNPLYDFFEQVVKCENDRCVNVNNLTYDHTYLLKLGQYLEAQNSAAMDRIKPYRPGEQIVSEREFTLNNTHFHFDTIDQLQNAIKYARKTHRKVNGETVRIPHFEQYLRAETDQLGNAVHKMYQDANRRNAVKKK